MSELSTGGGSAAEPGSLASMIPSASAGLDAAPTLQVPQWLFAFDAAGIATYRALALIGSHPEHRAGALVVVLAPFFHRGDERLSEANRLAPELWSDDRPVGSWPLIPFSAGPAQCAGMDVVLLLTSTALGVVVQQSEPVAGADLRPDSPLPGSLRPFPLASPCADAPSVTRRRCAPGCRFLAEGARDRRTEARSKTRAHRAHPRRGPHRAG